MKTILHQMTLALAAFLVSSQAHAQLNPALMKSKVDPEATADPWEQMLRQRQDKIRSGMPEEQAIKESVDQFIRKVESHRKEKFNSMAANLKAIKVGSDTKDDVIAKLGKTSNGNDDLWIYSVAPNFQAYVQFDATALVDSVVVFSDRETVYQAGKPLRLWGADGVRTTSAAEPTPVNRSAGAPADPEEGQIYFNTTEKSFYGWNGSGWVKLGSN